MREPKLGDGRLDTTETRRVRAGAKQPRAIKITINVDAASLKKLKALAGRTGVPYQRLLNVVLREGLARRSQQESRLTRLEGEVDRLKQRLAA